MSFEINLLRMLSAVRSNEFQGLQSLTFWITVQYSFFIQYWIPIFIFFVESSRWTGWVYPVRGGRFRCGGRSHGGGSGTGGGGGPEVSKVQAA